jgi:hypothetical protein
MPNFQPDICTFQDKIGYGAWDIGHDREHLQFVQVAAAMSPAIVLPAYDFLNILNSGRTQNNQLESHQTVHDMLSQIAGITAVSFTGFDLSKQDDFYNFLGYHQTTHAQLRQFFGIT